MHSFVVQMVWGALSLFCQGPPTSPAPRDGGASVLLEEDFLREKLSPGVWDARLTNSGFWQGYLAFWRAPEDGLTSVKTFDRKAGRCLAVEYLGNICRYNGEEAHPTLQFSSSIRPKDRFPAGPGWAPGQHQGRYMNTAVPLVEALGRRNFAERNDNVDTLFLTVLREKGAFYLMCGEPASPPTQAKLCYASHTGEGGPYHVALSGGNVNAKCGSVTLVDLSGPWTEPYGIATLVDGFRRNSLGKPEKGGSPWKGASSSWVIGEGKLVRKADAGETMLLTDSGTADGQWEVSVTPADGSSSVALVVRAKDEQNFLRFELGSSGTRLVKRVAGTDTVIAPSVWREAKLAPGSPHRLGVRLEGEIINLYVDDRPALYDAQVSPDLFREFARGGTQVGIFASGPGTSFQQFVGWPLFVDLPKTLASKLPAVPLKADGDIVVHDDFQGPSGSSLDGRKPGVGQGTWKAGQGEWVLQDGAAVLKAAPGFVRIDCGREDYEVIAKIQLPSSTHTWPDDWFPGIQTRSQGPGPQTQVGAITSRFVWQGKGLTEIEVWDQPPGPPDCQLQNATNLGWMANTPREIHLLRTVVRKNRVSYFCDDLLVGSMPTRVAKGTWVGMSIDPRGDASARFLEFTVRRFKD
jgi:hypothetical protein